MLPQSGNGASFCSWIFHLLPLLLPLVSGIFVQDPTVPLNEGPLCYTMCVIVCPSDRLTFTVCWNNHSDNRGKFHCCCERGGITSRRKPAQWVLVALVPGLATSLRAFCSATCPGLCWVLLSKAPVPRGTVSIWTLQASTGLSPASGCRSEGGHSSHCRSDLVLSARRSDDISMMARLQEREKLLQFNLETKIKQPLVDKDWIWLYIKKKKTWEMVICWVKEALG